MFVRGDGHQALDGGYLDPFFGGTYPTETWAAYMKLALEGEPELDFPDPAELHGESPTSVPPPTTSTPTTSTPTTSTPTTSTPTTKPPPTTPTTPTTDDDPHHPDDADHPDSADDPDGVGPPDSARVRPGRPGGAATDRFGRAARGRPPLRLRPWWTIAVAYHGRQRAGGDVVAPTLDDPVAHAASGAIGGPLGATR